MSNLSRRQLLAGMSAFSALGLAARHAVSEDTALEVGRKQSVKDAIRTQVLVVGAGASGIPAAIAAARAGAKVLLLEEDQVPGGAPVDMFVTFPCGNPRVGVYAEALRALNERFQLTDKTKPSYAAAATERFVRMWFMPSACLQVLYGLIRAEKNLKLQCSSPVTGVLVSEGSRNRIRGVTVTLADGRTQTIEADIVIDATGSGIVAALAGCECRYGTEARSEFHEPVGPAKASDKVQLCTLMMICHKHRPDAKIDMSKLSRMKAVSENENAFLNWAGTVECRDTRDPLALAEAQGKAIEQLEGLMEYVQKSGYLAELAPKLGVRESRRVVGDRMFTVNDLIAKKRPDDTIARGSYQLDAWGERAKLKHPITRGGYGIPYSTLLTKGMENLMVVGKSVSATHLALSAIRVQPIVSQMGQASGIAAALALSKETTLRSVPVDEIQQRLKAAGILTWPGTSGCQPI